MSKIDKYRDIVSAEGNFRVIDTIGVPHPYVIGAKHVVYAADHHGGRLDDEAIRRAEKAGIKCEHRGCTLPYAEHKQALLIECGVPLEGHGVPQSELHNYLTTIKGMDEADGFVGFAFVQKKED